MKKHSIRLIPWLAALSCLPSQTEAEEISGIVIPRDNEGMYVRNEQGQFEVTWTPETKVALMANTRLLAGLSAEQFEYKIQSSKEIVTFPVPKGPITGIKISRAGKHLETALTEAEEEKWIAESGLSLYFNQAPGKVQLATEEDPRFIGTWDPTTKPRTLSIKGEKYEISLKKGGQTTIPLFGLLTVKDCKPFVNRATVIGRKDGDILIADEIQLLPIGDQTANDDPQLPRYLFIGDSISGNYDKGLRETLAGKFNLHHPPTNCGPSGKGRKDIASWMGAYDQPGRHWDVISFNFGHWDAGSDKANYQSNLEAVIAELKKAGARLIWVTTCPVPKGAPPAVELTVDGRAPGRKTGVMEKYLNPWASEVISRHPGITICDQWQFVKDHENDLFGEWWKGDNVHFSGETADALGVFLGEHVAGIMGVKLERSQKPSASAPVNR